MSTKAQREAESLRKQDVAWRLHVAGATPQEIAASTDPKAGGPLFKDARGAAQAIRAVQRRHDSDTEDSPDNAPQHLKDDLARLSRVQRALWPAASGGDVAAAREIRQIIRTRAEMLGYIKGIEAPAGGKGDTIDELTAKREARRSAHA